MSTRVTCPEFRNLEPDLFCDCERFFTHLKAAYDYYDAITYSVSKNALATKPRRLITCLPAKEWHAGEIRYAPNIHTKLFVCYREARLEDCFVGSQNLVEPTTLNIMMRARGESIRKALHDYFTSIWKQAKSRQS